MIFNLHADADLANCLRPRMTRRRRGPSARQQFGCCQSRSMKCGGGLWRWRALTCTGIYRVDTLTFICANESTLIKSSIMVYAVVLNLWGNSWTFRQLEVKTALLNFSRFRACKLCNFLQMKSKLVFLLWQDVWFSTTNKESFVFDCCSVSWWENFDIYFGRAVLVFV